MYLWFIVCIQNSDGFIPRNPEWCCETCPHPQVTPGNLPPPPDVREHQLGLRTNPSTVPVETRLWTWGRPTSMYNWNTVLEPRCHLLLRATGFQGCFLWPTSLLFLSRGFRWDARTRLLTDTQTVRVSVSISMPWNPSLNLFKDKSKQRWWDLCSFSYLNCSYDATFWSMALSFASFSLVYRRSDSMAVDSSRSNAAKSMTSFCDLAITPWCHTHVRMVTTSWTHSLVSMAPWSHLVFSKLLWPLIFTLGIWA